MEKNRPLLACGYSHLSGFEGFWVGGWEGGVLCVCVFFAMSESIDLVLVYWVAETIGHFQTQHRKALQRSLRWMAVSE